MINDSHKRIPQNSFKLLDFNLELGGFIILFVTQNWMEAIYR